MITRAIARRVGGASAVLILLSSALSIWGAVRPSPAGALGPFGWLTDTIFAVGLAMMVAATLLFLKLGHDGEG